jgi:hypothetical protein
MVFFTLVINGPKYTIVCMYKNAKWVERYRILCKMAEKYNY